MSAIVAFGDHGRPAPRRQRLLVGHLEEEQIGELLDVVAVGEPVVAQHVAVFPELLNDLSRVPIRRHGSVPVRAASAQAAGCRP